MILLSQLIDSYATHMNDLFAIITYTFVLGCVLYTSAKIIIKIAKRKD